MDLGIGRRRVRRESRQGLGRPAERDPAARRRHAVDLPVPVDAATHEHRPPRRTRARITPTSSAATIWCLPSIVKGRPSRSGCSTTAAGPTAGSGLGEAGRGPHKVLISPYDPEKHVWIVDDDQHIINIFTNNGRLVRTMGERGVPGRGRTTSTGPPTSRGCPTARSSWPTAMPAPGLRNSIPTGKFLMDWGRPPVDPDKPGPYEFWSVHSIGISRDRRIFVADREHHRMQVFDEQGKFLEMWPTGHDSAVLTHIVTEDDFIWLADWTTDRLIKYDLNGRYILDIGGPWTAARSVRRRPPDQRRSGTQPVRDRGRQRPLAEVQTQARRRPGENHRADGRLGPLHEVTGQRGAPVCDD